MSFDRLISVAAAGDGQFTIEVPDGWQQGRGSFGGLVLGILTRAAETAVDAARPLRALNGEIVGPVQPGPAAIAIEVLRAGAGVTAVAARLAQQGEVQAFAVATFGRVRDTFSAPPGIAAPVVPPWRELAPVPLGPPAAPVFTQHVEFRMAGPPPFSSAPVAETIGWVRLRDPGPTRDAAFVVAMIDTWFPALLVQERAPRPIGTLTFAFQRIGSLDGLDPDAPLLYRGRNVAGSEGYAVEFRELWGEDGRLIALNQQTIVVIK